LGTKIPIWCALVARSGRGSQMARLVSACGERGLPAHPLQPAELEACLRERPERHPAVVMLRMPSGIPADELAALHDAACAPGATRTRWLDRVDAVARAHDKVACLASLRRAGLPVPPTRVVLRDDRGELALEGRRFVVKPLRGASGHGVVVGLAAGEALARARAFADLTGGALVQPELGGGIDHRVFVARGKVLAGMRRLPSGPAGRANLHYGGRAEAWSPDESLLRLALAAADTLQLAIAGVDLLIHEGRPVLLEVNTCPGLVGIEAATGLDVAGALAGLALDAANGR